MRCHKRSAVVKSLAGYGKNLCHLFAQPRVQSGLNAQQQAGA
jgi:hypothetical protein